MSDAPQQAATPRTDAALTGCGECGWSVPADFARTLERELGESQERVRKAFVVGKHDWENENAALRAERDALVKERDGFCESIVTALYDSTNVSIIGDGCCSESRDKDILRHIVRVAIDAARSSGGKGATP